ncbi:MAG: hypothetical protein D6717_12960, partial [Gammaproteobacteria bacterium]
MTRFENRSDITLEGLDGSNLLGFLAALGLLRLLDSVGGGTAHGPTMRWQPAGSTWHPVVSFSQDGAPASKEDLLDALEAAIEAQSDESPFTWAKDTAVSPEEFRRFAQAAALRARPDERRAADFAAAFACEALLDRQGRVQDSALRTMSGAGHQHYLESMLLLVRSTNREHLEHALFERWAYRDERPSMRWDP